MDGIPDADLTQHILDIEARDPNKKIKLDTAIIALLESKNITNPFAKPYQESNETYPPHTIPLTNSIQPQESTPLSLSPTNAITPPIAFVIDPSRNVNTIQSITPQLFSNNTLVKRVPIKPEGQVSGNSKIVYYSEVVSIEEMRASYPEYAF